CGGRVVHADDLARGDELDVVAVAREERGDVGFAAHEKDPGAELAGGAHRARDDLAGGAVAAHRVEGDGHAHAVPAPRINRRRSPGDRGTTRSCCKRRGEASLPRSSGRSIVPARKAASSTPGAFWSWLSASFASGRAS